MPGVLVREACLATRDGVIPSATRGSVALRIINQTKQKYVGERPGPGKRKKTVGEKLMQLVIHFLEAMSFVIPKDNTTGMGNDLIIEEYFLKIFLKF